MSELSEHPRLPAVTEANIPPPDSESQATVNEAAGPTLYNRSTVLKLGIVGLGMVFGGGIFLGEQRAIAKKWPHNQPSATILPPRDPRVRQSFEQISLFFPGYGDMRSWGEAMTVRNHGNLPANEPIAYVDYSNQGVGAEEMSEVIRDRLRGLNVKRVRFIARSYGGPFGLEVLSKLGLAISSATLIASPSRLADAHYAGLGAVAADAPDNAEMDLSIKALVNLNDQDEAHGYQHVFSNIQRAEQATMEGSNGVALKQEVKTLRNFHLFDPKFMAAASKVLIAGYSEAAYSGTRVPRTDRTVNVVAGSNGYRRFFTALGVPYHDIPNDFLGHANVRAAIEALTPWTKALNHRDTKLNS